MLTGMQSRAGIIVKPACGSVVQEYVHVPPDFGFAVGYRNLSCEYIFVGEAGVEYR